MKKQALFCLLLSSILASGAAAQSQDAAATAPQVALHSTKDAVPYAATIKADDLKSYLTELASDAFEGRETGTEGQRKAAEYIAGKFEEFGLPAIGEAGSYFQAITFTTESWNSGGPRLEVNGTSYKHLSDFITFPSLNASRPEFKASEVLFLGYGIDDPRYSDYNGVDVRGKTVMIYSGEPVNDKDISWLTGDQTRSEWSENWRKKLEAAHLHGVSTLLIIDPEIKKTAGEGRRGLLRGEMKMGEGEQPELRYANSVLISSTLAREIVGKKFRKFVRLRDGIRKSGKPARMPLSADLSLGQLKDVKQVTGVNVLGYIEGTDPVLKNEVVVVSAHYDHLGKRGESIYRGADDNASGTSTVMEIAQALAQARKEGRGPRRSVLCLLVSGEEKGLLGSAYYAEHPVFPIENTIANVNVDMVGRTDKAHEGNPEYIYVIGSDRLSTELHHINEAVNATYTNVTLDYTFNAEDDPNRFYYRSDHYNFAKKGIPAIFYFSGVHEDYHQPGDTADKIMYGKMEKIGHLIFYTTWELANRPERIKVDVKQE